MVDFLAKGDKSTCGFHVRRKNFADHSVFTSVQDMCRQLAEGTCSMADPELLHLLATVSGLHVAVFFCFTVWSTRAVTKRIGCVLHFAKMLGGEWIDLVDMGKEEFPSACTYEDDDDDLADLPLTPSVPKGLLHREATAITPTEEKVILPMSAASGSGHGSLLDDCIHEMAEAFPDEAPNGDNVGDNASHVCVAPGSGGTGTDGTAMDAVALSEQNKALAASVSTTCDADNSTVA